MRLTFVTDLGQSYVIEVDPQMELENIMALLEADSGYPVEEQSISFEGKEVSDPKATLASFGIGDGAMLLLRKKVTVAGRTTELDPEMMRLQFLGNPQLMQQLRNTNPELADAVANNDPHRFSQLLAESRAQQRVIELERDPYNLDAQKKIEEAIRMQAVMENLQNAMEHSPESFGRVIMLYIPVEINGHPVKAFVDSGAQQTIMNPSCAEACGIARLIDTRFSGIAKGVGTAKILGRVHMAQLKVADVFLPCSITIMEGRDVDLLFGLDMLKAHQACIDLEKNVLRIRGREVPFLPEHELPRSALNEMGELAEEGGSQPGGSSSGSGPGPSTAPSQTQFPGHGNTLGSTAAQQSRNTPQPHQQAPAPARSAGGQSTFSESDISTLESLGATREQAIGCLQAAGGNLDVAASMFF
ncbi:DNA damage-inducible protein 1 [Tulasnella sp. 331]|nr:DNA damage-inducible protein 1 [Tulasnella sp. 331]